MRRKALLFALALLLVIALAAISEGGEAYQVTVQIPGMT